MKRRNAKKHLYQEILRRFPEVKSLVHRGDQELPYVVVGYIVDWLLSIAKPHLDHQAIQRVVDFDRWCSAEPRSATAEDDILTIETVALIKKLFRYDALLPIVPHLIPREDLLKNRDYFVTWVGAERYEAAMNLVR